MDVHGVEIRGARHILVGKVEYLSFHQHTAVRCVIEFHKAAYCGSGCPASYPGNGGRGPKAQ